MYMLLVVDIYALIEEKNEQETERETEKKVNGSYVYIYIYIYIYMKYEYIRIIYIYMCLSREEYLGLVAVVVANECLSLDLIYR